MKNTPATILSLSVLSILVFSSSVLAEETVIKKAEGELEPKFSKMITAPQNKEAKPKSKVLKQPEKKELTGTTKVISKAEGKELKPKSSAIIGPEGLKNLEKRKQGTAPVLTADFLSKSDDKKLEKKDNMITVRDGKRVEE